jgi:hypothetical protein
MAHAWSALDRVQERRRQPFAEVLRLRVASPELHSFQLAERLSRRLGRPVNSGWVRLNLHRAGDMSACCTAQRSVPMLPSSAVLVTWNVLSSRRSSSASSTGLSRCRAALRRRPPDTPITPGPAAAQDRLFPFML